MARSCPYGNSVQDGAPATAVLALSDKLNISRGVSPQQVSGIGCTYHSHEVTPRRRAPGVLDLGSVTRRVGKETVLFHGDLQGDTGCEHGARAIPSPWSCKQEEAGTEWAVGVQPWK